MNIFLRITIFSSIFSSYALGMFNQLPQIQAMMVQHYRVAAIHESRITQLEQNNSQQEKINSQQEKINEAHAHAIRQLGTIMRDLIKKNDSDLNGHVPSQPTPQTSSLAKIGEVIIKTGAAVVVSTAIVAGAKTVIPPAGALVDNFVMTGAAGVGAKVAQSFTLANVKEGTTIGLMKWLLVTHWLEDKFGQLPFVERICNYFGDRLYENLELEEESVYH